MEKYDPATIEPRWQKKWEESGLYKAIDPPTGGAKKYILIEFPYPSGERLHVGHGRSYCCLDSVSRYFRMKGFNVLYPIGWDAFGLPAENYAIKTGINPAVTTAQNIANARLQAKRWGLSFDWSREVNTTDSNYYKWTQWIFLKLLEKDLAYRAEVPVNWCPSCRTNLADEEVLADGTHERCGGKTEKRLQKQWLLKITAYADRLLEDLKTVDYLPKISQQQINWIGKSEGVEIEFNLASQGLSLRGGPERSRRNSSDGEGIGERFIRAFTTAHDTIFGATFMVLAPEYARELLDLVPSEKKAELSKYIKESLNKSEQERKTKVKTKTGVDAGFKVINPFTNKEIPVFVADYVLMEYGTGAIMGVPAHDARDHEFARKYNLEIKPVIKPTEENKTRVEEDGFWDYEEIKTKFADKSLLFNSGFLDGLTSGQAKHRIEKEVKKRGIGKKIAHYHLHDWVFSRQHYWGEPIPVVYCAHCAKTPGISNFILRQAQDDVKQSRSIKFQISNINGIDYAIIPVPEEQLPVELPYVENYKPTGTGESPLAAVSDWVNTKCPVCGGPARRETDTMPNWAGSNWYYLGYVIALDIKDQRSKIKNIFEENKNRIRYWLPVDLYNGGMEHTTLHLLYSRFIYKFLYDLGAVPTPEPYAKRRSHGVVLGPDGAKMSKSRGNVANPDEVVALYGADTFRLYESFMGPFDKTVAWSEEGVEGCFRFLKRVWQLVLTSPNSFTRRSLGADGPNPLPPSNPLISYLHRTIKKVGEDIEALKFNTAIAAMMEFTNKWQDDKEGLGKDDLKKFLLILVPFAPHITEELWQRIGEKFSIHKVPWPKYEEELVKEKKILIVIEVNGKVREKIKIKDQKSSFDKLRMMPSKVEASKIKNKIEEIALKSPKVQKYLEGKKIRKIVFVPGRLINFVT